MLIIGRMGQSSIKITLVLAAGVLIGCAEDPPVAYNSDNPGGYFHYISTDPGEIYRNKVNHEAELEAHGVEPPLGNASWREYWTKLIAYYTSAGELGTNQQVSSYIVQQRRARGLPPL
jgi:hypothetical protein